MNRELNAAERTLLCHIASEIKKHPDKYQRVFVNSSIASADFWAEGFLKVFVSHLSSNRSNMSALKASLADWGISAFIAHEDINWEWNGKPNA